MSSISWTSMPVESRASLAAAVQLAMLVRKLRWLPLTWQARTNLYSKGCLQIPATSQWYVPISTVLWDMAIHRLSFVARRASRSARVLTLEVLVEAWTVPAGFPHIDVPFSTASDFQKFESHLSFYFWPTPEMDTYPAEEHLTPNIVNTTKTAHVAISMVCTLSRVNVCFSYFLFKRKIVESTLKVHRIELVRKAEPPIRTRLIRIFHLSRAAFPDFFIWDRFWE